MKGKRLLILNRFNNKFAAMYADYFKSRGNTVRLMLGGPSAAEITMAAHDADIILSTWADPSLAVVTKAMLPDSPCIVTHLRSYEVFEPRLLHMVDWRRVDGVVFVAEHVREYANKAHPQVFRSIVPETTVIHNSVPVAATPIVRRIADVPPRRLYHFGYLNHKKGIPLLLQCYMALLMRYQAGTELHLCGEWQSARFEQYFEAIVSAPVASRGGVVKFHGWCTPEEMAGHLEDADLVVSTSPWEGCPHAVIEAMAAGRRVLVHAWPGAADLFGADLCFGTVDEFVEKAGRIWPTETPTALRDVAMQHFNSEFQLPKLEQFIDKMEERHNASKI